MRKELGENIKARGGLMTPEHVAEGFFRLLTQCDSGAAMAVTKVRKDHINICLCVSAGPAGLSLPAPA